MERIRSWGGRFVLVVAAVLISLGADGRMPVVEAGFESCRTDPIVLLSDGTIVQMVATIATDVSNVQSVEYTLHAPRGLKVVQIYYLPSPLVSRESVNFFDDAPPNQFIGQTLVRTYAGTVDVTATMSVLQPGLYAALGSATGPSGLTQSITLTPTKLNVN